MYIEKDWRSYYLFVYPERDVRLLVHTHRNHSVMMTGAGLGISKNVLVENFFFAKVQKTWIIIAPEKTGVYQW